MSERDRKTKPGAAAGAAITKRSLDYACSFEDFAVLKLPELKGYAREKRSVSLQAAITVATLILMERRGGAGWSELHQSVSSAFAPSVAHRHLDAIQDLSRFLLQSNAPLKAYEIPSYAGLAGAADAKLVGSIGEWLARSITKKDPLDPTGLKIAAAMGRSAWTSATMIVRWLSKNG